MTQDEIIRMAYEAGGVKGEHTVLNHTWFELTADQLERFASLVAAHEREKQAKQELVAWISSNCPKCKNKVKGAPDSGWVWRCPKCAFEWPVDNAATVRTKDLTDDEIFQFQKEIQYADVDPITFARAVIAADREKNRG